MLEIKSTISGYFEAKGSKFYAYLEPCKDIRSIRIRQNELRSANLKCVHVVYAARAINEFNQILEDFSDDGEPKGSSAAPMLNVLRGANLLAAAYVVRYFGGTLLGVGGLVRAYSAALNDAITNAKASGDLQPFVQKRLYELQIDYDILRQVQYLCEGSDYETEFSDKITLKLNLSKEQAKTLHSKLQQKFPTLKSLEILLH